MNKEELKQKLTPEQYKVTQEKATEAPFTGEFLYNKETGIYNCVVCGNELFSSSEKFDSDSGWPSFSDVIAQGKVKEVLDTSHGMIRTEVLCSKCDAHLGHVFEAGSYTNTGVYYCINSAALNFKKGKDDDSL